MIVAWLQEHPDDETITHLFVCDIHYLLYLCAAFDIRYTYYRNINSTVDWIVSFIEHHASTFY